MNAPQTQPPVTWHQLSARHAMKARVCPFLSIPVCIPRPPGVSCAPWRLRESRPRQAYRDKDDRQRYLHSHLKSWSPLIVHGTLAEPRKSQSCCEKIRKFF